MKFKQFIPQHKASINKSVFLVKYVDFCGYEIFNFLIAEFESLGNILILCKPRPNKVKVKIVLIINYACE